MVKLIIIILIIIIQSLLCSAISGSNSKSFTTAVHCPVRTIQSTMSGCFFLSYIHLFYDTQKHLSG